MRGVKTVRYLVLLVAICAGRTAFAQSGQVNGAVTDSTGAAVPAAAVTVKNLATNASRSATTGDAGLYVISGLVPGRYDLDISKDSFKTLHFSAITITVDQALTLNAVLEVSGSTQSVTVEGEIVAELNTTDAQVSNVISERQVRELPLITRDPYQLILLTPGANSTNSGLGGFSVNGNRDRNNNFMLDGADNNDPGVPATGLATLNPDSTAEFRVITNNYQPEFGRNTGSVIDIVTKSGTNSLHGDVYWFGRYNALGARDFFNPAQGPSGAAQNPYVRNDFGVSVGGPIIKDKTFIFGNYEGQRFATTLTNTAVVPTAAFKTGIFTFDGVNYNLSTPASANNRFHLALDPQVQKVLALMPSPNAGPVDDIRGNFNFASPDHFSADNYLVKVDHNFSSRHVLSVRYLISKGTDDNLQHLDVLPGIGGVSVDGRTQTLAGHLVSTFSQNVINDLRASGARSTSAFGCTGLQTLDSLGGLDQFGRGRDFNLPNITTVGCTALGDSDGQIRHFGTYNLGDKVTWVVGRHTMKFGVDFADEYENNSNNFSSRSLPSFAINTFFGVNATTPAAANNNQILQDSVWGLLGVIGFEQQAQFFDNQSNRLSSDLRGFREHDFYAYWQDAYKLRSNLTLNYGLRYEYSGVPYEVHDLLSNTSVAALSGPAPIVFQTVGRHGNLPLYTNDPKGFEPRVGFAWDPFKSGKTSIRGGYGLFRDRSFFNIIGNIRSLPPLGQTFVGLPILDFGPTSKAQLNNVPLPTSVVPTNSITDGSLAFVATIDPNLRVATAQDWNFGIQRQLPGNVLLEVNYVGAKGDHILRVVDGNAPDPAKVAQLRTICRQNQLTDPNNPNICHEVPSGPGAFTDVQGINLYQGGDSGFFPFNATQNSALFHSNLTKSIGNSIYHALQVTATRRFSHGLFIQGAYTYSHAIDNSADPLVAQIHNVVFPVDSSNLRLERGNSGFDVRHHLVVNYTAELPFGNGKARLNHGFVGKALEGWSLSGVSTFAGGTPIDIFTVRDSAGTGSTQRANFNPNATPVPLAAGASARLQTGPNVGLFSAPDFGTHGNLGRNHFYGPGINNWDVVAAKKTRLSERLSLEFRAEFYNIFNRVQLGQPDEFIENARNFGQSVSQVGRPDGTTGARQIQAALKLVF
jgi:hypothetical protein